MATIALCVGHSRIGDSGAVNTDGVSEHAFNSTLARLTAHILREQGHEVHVIREYPMKGYSAAMCWLGDYLRKISAQIAVELHFNCAGPLAEGHEWLHWHNSPKGQRLASCFNAAFKEAFPKSKARGIVAIKPEGRGAGFLLRTPCPAVILEPFFGSNKSETTFFTSRLTALAHAYAEALNDYLK